ncbi:hypothetical protein GCM10011512_02580 [Tersicoccus solisilvae]|uniref:Uncharacterized protein n=1 Tax=Tersicoccus solisilvae TaxID=1882339 RepID=A0ABQ1NKE3_9MICC|nr:hypothetical protein [Tersicoccus solisilvae]GGC79407.1 hypothetical protein GCM10011512_02580 [Tersicoccus solisilvae]
MRTRERSAQDVLADAMRDSGLDLDLWELDPDQPAAHPGAGAVAVLVSRWRGVRELDARGR